MFHFAQGKCILNKLKYINYEQHTVAFTDDSTMTHRAAWGLSSCVQNESIGVRRLLDGLHL